MLSSFCILYYIIDIRIYYFYFRITDSTYHIIDIYILISEYVGIYIYVRFDILCLYSTNYFMIYSLFCFQLISFYFWVSIL